MNQIAHAITPNSANAMSGVRVSAARHLVLEGMKDLAVLCPPVLH
jgi:hypothetical protein